MVIDKAHEGVFGKCKATGADLRHIRETMRAILEGRAMCSSCSSMATHICGSTEKAVFLCTVCAGQHHGGCDNVVELGQLQVAVNEAQPQSLRPHSELIVGARFVEKSTKKPAQVTEWRVDSVNTTALAWIDWTASISVAFGPSKPAQTKKLPRLERDYTATAQAVFVDRYFAVCRSWMVQYRTTMQPLYGLVGTVKRLPLRDITVVREMLHEGTIDGIMQHLVKERKPMRWMPHLSTAPALKATPSHMAANRKRKTGA